ncbi:MAG TPA: heavy metal translocating P-type ATPase [Firmicutes bacterium]|nr:heavy metal translocating P-type ATPase [Bacillota bacterium]
MKLKFNVEGMTCASCQAHVSKAVEQLEGTSKVNVNLLKNTLDVEVDEAKCDASKIEDAVQKAGYKAYIPNANKKTDKLIEKNHDLAYLIFSLVDLLVIMYFSMGHMMWGWPVPKVFNMHTNPMGFSLVQFILVLPIIFLYRKYFINGFKKLIKLSPNMDTLIAIGATFSIAYGIYCLFMISMEYTEYHMYLYFEAAGMILTLVSLGKYLEKLSKRKTTTAIEKLMDLSPKEAVVLKDNIETKVKIEEVKLGDIVVVKKGDSVPVDGKIIEGNASIDQSNITGESIPVYKIANDDVYSSTIVTAGYIKVKATKVGEDTSIANIIKLVDEASNSKAPISKLADKISGVFVPVILAIALVTFIINLIVSKDFQIALNFAITVIVIACPCALGLATPVAIMVGTGKSAENGLLIKNAEILEKAHHIKTVVLDKTGTITEGKPRVTDFESFESDSDLLSVIYSLENMSEHPLALSMIEYAKENNANLLEVKEFKTTDGRGIEGIVNNSKYFIGNYKSVEELKLNTKELEDKVNNLSYQGKTPLLIIKDNKVVGLIAVKDEVKESSKQAISELRNKGIKVIMLTGDNRKTAEAIAKEVNVDEVISDVHPEDKQKVINSLKTNDKNLIAMVGDGVNDAPALTSADLGIAIGGGSDIAIESADIVLLRNDLLDVLNVISLSKRVINTIKLSLFWAFFYNFVCVILSTGFLYYLTDKKFMMTPMIASVAMSISSVSVVLTSLTINFFKVKKAKNSNNSSVSIKEKNKMQTKVIYVDGMMCNHCKAHVEEACKKVPGVSDAVVSLQDKNVTVTCEEKVTDEALKQSIKEAGYEAK